ncbi:TlyA family RNA methyltransferase [Deltaproteobacteria bacterium TL4]
MIDGSSPFKTFDTGYPLSFLMKQRIDLLLVEKGLVPSREKAQALIMAGKVRVDSQLVDKVGKKVAVDVEIEVLEKDHPYVSRGGVKLQAALEAFQLSPQGMTVLDIGASTGGFTHCLLLQGARHVYSVDVGYGQLAWELQQHPQVTSIERTNIRKMEFDRIGTLVDLVVVDASFISLRLIFPAVWRFLKPEGRVIALVKPQFEAGKREIGKGGRVTSSDTHLRVQQDVTDAAQTQGFEILGWIESSIVGKKSGNKEFLLLLGKPSKTQEFPH